MQLLQTRNCPECQLADVDLVHAQLQDADLAGAKLQRANLSQARLDGANLRGADLSFTSLNGASLRGANLQGSTLLGTDLRDVDLTGASLDLDALESAHWSGAVGLQPYAQSHALHRQSRPGGIDTDRTELNPLGCGPTQLRQKGGSGSHRPQLGHDLAGVLVELITARRDGFQF